MIKKLVVLSFFVCTGLIAGFDEKQHSKCIEQHKGFKEEFGFCPSCGLTDCSEPANCINDCMRRCLEYTNNKGCKDRSLDSAKSIQRDIDCIPEKRNVMEQVDAFSSKNPTSSLYEFPKMEGEEGRENLRSVRSHEEPLQFLSSTGATGKSTSFYNTSVIRPNRPAFPLKVWTANVSVTLGIPGEAVFSESMDLSLITDKEYCQCIADPENHHDVAHFLIRTVQGYPYGATSEQTEIMIKDVVDNISMSSMRDAYSILLMPVIYENTDSDLLFQDAAALALKSASNRGGATEWVYLLWKRNNSAGKKYGLIACNTYSTSDQKIKKITLFSANEELVKKFLSHKIYDEGLNVILCKLVRKEQKPIIKMFENELSRGFSSSDQYPCTLCKEDINCLDQLPVMIRNFILIEGAQVEVKAGDRVPASRICQKCYKNRSPIERDCYGKYNRATRRIEGKLKQLSL